MLNILGCERYFVYLYSERMIFFFALLMGLSVPTCSMAQDDAAPAFHTVGYGYDSPQSIAKRCGTEGTAWSVEECDSDEGQSPDSSKLFVPMVAMPLKDIKVNSAYGFRRDPIDKGRIRMHRGIDLKARYEEVYSMLPGVVTAASYSVNGGYYVTVKNDVCICSYLHLSDIMVSVGQHIDVGQVIAISGNSGKRTTGPHLHISCRLGNESGKSFNPLLLLRFVSEQLTFKN